MRAGITLFSGTMIGSTVGNSQYYVGGRTALVLSATAYGGNFFLATQSADGTWININGTTYSANQVTSYDLPPGQYRMVSGGSSNVNVSATLVPITYGG